MPHIIVKWYPGRTDEQRVRLSDEIVKTVSTVSGCNEKSISVAFEEIAEKDWEEQVYKADIVKNRENLVKMPGYGSLAGE